MRARGEDLEMVFLFMVRHIIPHPRLFTLSARFSRMASER